MEKKPVLSKPTNILLAGRTLKADQRLVSSNGAYILRMQEDDGNLCIYQYANGKQGAFVWGSMKYGFKGAELKMQSDGNLVVYANGKPQWASETTSFFDKKFSGTNKPVRALLNNNGVLILVNAKGAKVWSSDMKKTVAKKTTNILLAGQTLKAGERLTSSNGAYILRMQEDDGNLCIYQYANGKQGAFVWGSMKYGFKGAELKMQSDGNLVVYAGGEAKWASETTPFFDKKFSGANKPVRAVLNNNGVLLLVNAKGAKVWSSK